MPDDRSPGKLIGVLGGTFDPVHVGHLRLAIEIFEHLGLDHVRLIPVGLPNHREPPEASPEQRVSMLQSVADGNRLVVDTRELERDGVSYMVDTLGSLQADFPNDALCLIVGHDAYCDFTQWDRWQELFARSHIVVATRPDAGEITAPELVEITRTNRAASASDLRRKMAGGVYFQAISELAISSTDIRRRCREQLDLAYLVPEPVAQIIHREKLYRKAYDRNPS